MSRFIPLFFLEGLVFFEGYPTRVAFYHNLKRTPTLEHVDTKREGAQRLEIDTRIQFCLDEIVLKLK